GRLSTSVLGRVAERGAVSTTYDVISPFDRTYTNASVPIVRPAGTPEVPSTVYFAPEGLVIGVRSGLATAAVPLDGRPALDVSEITGLSPFVLLDAWSIGVEDDVAAIEASERFVRDFH